MVKPVGTKVRRSKVRRFSAPGSSTAHLLTVLIRDLRSYKSRQHGTTVLPEWSHRGRALFRRHLCPKMGPQDEPIGRFNNSQCGAHDSAHAKQDSCRHALLPFPVVIWNCLCNRGVTQPNTTKYKSMFLLGVILRYMCYGAI